MSEGSRSVSVADDSAVAADRSGSLWLRLGQAWRGVTLAVAFVLGFAPLVPRYPSVGFDASWISAVRDAGSRDLAWGTDFIYTAGPLGDLYTGAWSPELSWLIPGIGIAYCLIAAALAYELLRSHPWWTTPLAALLVTSGLVGRDAIYLLPPFLLATLVASEAPVDDPPAPTRRLVWLAIAAAPAGLLPLVKLSGVPVAVLSVAYCFLVLARRGEWSRAVVVLVAPFVTLVVAWLAVGQPLSSLWDWARTAVMVVGGYSQALAQAGPFVYVVVFVTSGAAITLIVLARLGSERGRLERIAFAALTAATCFLAFKSGFVRQDAHVLLAASSLLAVVAVVVCRLPRLAACAVGAVGVVTWFVMAHAAAVSTPQIVGDALQRAWLDAPRAAADRLFRSDRLEARYEAAEAAIRRDPRMPQVAPGGSYDLYTSELSFLFAQGVDWSPDRLCRAALPTLPAWPSSTVRTWSPATGPTICWSASTYGTASGHRWVTEPAGCRWLAGMTTAAKQVSTYVSTHDTSPEASSTVPRTPRPGSWETTWRWRPRTAGTGWSPPSSSIRPGGAAWFPLCSGPATCGSPSGSTTAAASPNDSCLSSAASRSWSRRTSTRPRPSPH